MHSEIAALAAHSAAYRLYTGESRCPSHSKLTQILTSQLSIRARTHDHGGFAFACYFTGAGNQQSRIAQAAVHENAPGPTEADQGSRTCHSTGIWERL